LTLSNNSIAENSPANSLIGIFSSQDPDAGDGHTYSLVTGTGDTDNTSFSIVGNELRINNSPNFETKSAYNIRLRTTDKGGLLFDQAFTVNISDIDEGLQIPIIAAALANDTGITNNDRLTLDPTISGQTTRATSLVGNLNGNGFVDISNAMNNDGSFAVSLEQYNLLSKGSMPDGEYTLALKAKDITGQESEVTTVSFTLDRTPPPVSFTLAAASDTGVLADRITSQSNVVLEGQTDPGLMVKLVGTPQNFKADETGKFSFTNVLMPSAGQAPFTVVAEDMAGNQGRSLDFLTREGINRAPKITSSPATTFDASQQKIYTYQIVATDPDLDALTYNLLKAPEGAEIDRNGLIKFTLPTTLEPDYNFSIEVSDGRGGTDTQTFVVNLPGVSDSSNQTGEISGTIWEDINKNGTRDNLIADSVADFSGTQGQNNWYYGYYDGPFISSDFQQMTQFTIGSTPPLSGTTPNWWVDESTLWTSITADSTHPNGINNNFGRTPVEQWSVRRWVSEVNGEIEITGKLAKLDGQTAGNGVVGKVIVDGVELWSQSIESNNTQGSSYKVKATVKAGSVVDFALDPKSSNDISDSTVFTASISQFEPGIAGIEVFIDLNNNGLLDQNEPRQTSSTDNLSTPSINETGQYKFTNLRAGNYIIREIAPTGYQQVFPLSQPSTNSINFDDLPEGVNPGNILIDKGIKFTTVAIPDDFTIGDTITVETLSSDFLVFSNEVSISSPNSFLANGGGSNDALISFEKPISSISLTSDDFQFDAKDIIRLIALSPTENPNKFTIVAFDEASDDAVTAPDNLLAINLGGSTFSHVIFQTTTEQEAFDDLTFTTTAVPNFHSIKLKSGEVVSDILFGNQRINPSNLAPQILSRPISNASSNVLYRYELKAIDRDGDPLTYTLTNAPDGMIIDKNGQITWNPGATGIYDVVIEVKDGKGGVSNQNYKITVGADTEAPKVSLGFSGTVIEVGNSLDLQIAAQDDVAVKDISLSFNGTPVAITPNLPNQINNASLTLNQVGLFEVLAKATDTSGKVGTKALKVRVINPKDKEAPDVQLDLSQFDPLKPITDITNIVGSIKGDGLEFYRVDIAPVSLIDLNNPGENDSDYITIAQGTSTVDNGILAQIDPRLYRNDSYYVRIFAQDYSGNINVQGVVLGISSQNKPGEFRLEYTDLSIPLTGIPIEVKRVYNSLDSQLQGDFGYGWNLALQDAQIQEASRDGRDLSNSDFFTSDNAFTVGTRVSLTTPDGRRVGYTFNAILAGTSLFGSVYKPVFTPDPGVYDTLEVDDANLSIRKDGSVGLFLFSFLGFNPNEYRLKTKDGTVYRYDQFKGLLDITDRNSNKLVYTDEGITSSTGQSITFKRDTQNRITEIIDPNGKAIKYSYDTQGDLSGVSDRTNATTRFEYDTLRSHYITKVVDPLGRGATRTEYDEQGRIKRLIDADGNALDLAYTNGASSQTVKDPLGNTITRVFDKRGNVIEEVDQLGGITKRTYDANDNLLSKTNPEGNTKLYTYDSRGNKLSETDGEGNTKRYTYNQTSKPLTETDALGNTVTYTYDANDNLTSRKDALGNTTTYKYTANGLLTAVVDANGKTSTFSYDAIGNLLELTDPTGAKTKFTYDGNGQVLTSTDGLGAVTSYIYDAQGRTISRTDPTGNITKIEYNPAGEKIAEIDSLGRRTEYRYNSRGLLVETIFPDTTPLDSTDNPRTKNEYDALDRVVAELDELGRKTQHVYDKLGRKIETILPDATPNNPTDNPRTKQEYDKAGRVIADIDELGNRTELGYDKADMLISRANALKEVTTYTYDADGRQISMTDALGRKTNYVFDGLDRLISTIYANNANQKTAYDPLGRVVSETDLAGNTTKYEYDALGRLTAVIDALNQRTEYKYDAVGNQTEQKDANNHVTKFEYDALRRRKAMVLPGGQRKETVYDPVGNVLRETDANGVTTTYEYDARNRITKKSFSDGTPTESFTYTLTGELATVIDNRGTTSYSYDDRDRLLSRTEPDGRKIQYTYDLAGNILTLNVPSRTTSYTYDSLNRLDTVTAPDRGKTDYTYDKVGNLIKTEFPNGVSETQQFDLLNRLTYLENRNGTGIISSYAYTLDAIGNRTKVFEQDGRIIEYSYDLLYRLTQEKITDTVAGNRATDYKFDAVGNRLERTDSVAGKTTYTYDVNDRLLEEVLGSKVIQYQYDAKGNLTAKVENGQTQAVYKWNAKGELAAVEITENGITGTIEFEYDHQGIRVAIKQNGEETCFLVDNNQQQYAQVIEEYQVDGTVKATYVHGWDLISQTNSNGTNYYQVDGLGSTRQLTNNAGTIRVEYDYDAYGSLTSKTGNASNNYLFAGEQFDEAVDEYYLRARYYNPAAGRFSSTDPFEGYKKQPITLNDYLYGKNNPIIFIDPDGKVAIEYAATLDSTLNKAAFVLIGFIQGLAFPSLYFIGNFLTWQNQDDISIQWDEAIKQTEKDLERIQLALNIGGFTNKFVQAYAEGFDNGTPLAIKYFRDIQPKPFE
jgi:RHS repeat-associated protein